MASDLAFEKAKEIIERTKHLQPFIDDSNIGDHMDKVIWPYLEAKGFIEGTLSERKRLMEKFRLVVGKNRASPSASNESFWGWI